MVSKEQVDLACGMSQGSAVIIADMPGQQVQPLYGTNVSPGLPEDGCLLMDEPDSCPQDNDSDRS